MPTPDTTHLPALGTNQRVALAKLALIEPAPSASSGPTSAAGTSPDLGTPTQKFQDFVRHQPLLALGGAAAAGFALMYFNKSPLLKRVATLAGSKVAMAALKRALG